MRDDGTTPNGRPRKRKWPTWDVKTANPVLSPRDIEWLQAHGLTPEDLSKTDQPVPKLPLLATAMRPEEMESAFTDALQHPPDELGSEAWKADVRITHHVGLSGGRVEWEGIDKGALTRFDAELSRTLAGEPETSLEPAAVSAINRPAARQALVQPLLAAKGWSVQDWANHSTVDFHTADNYLKGITNPYRSTRKKLADSLGVRVTDLPE